MLLAFGGAGRALDAISTSGWSDANIASPELEAETGPVTLTWTSGGVRFIELNVAGGSYLSTTYEYEIDDDGWATYSTPFSVNSGQSVNWRFAATESGNGSANVTVNDALRGGALIDGFAVNVSGF